MKQLLLLGFACVALFVSASDAQRLQAHIIAHTHDDVRGNKISSNINRLDGSKLWINIITAEIIPFSTREFSEF